MRYVLEFKHRHATEWKKYQDMKHPTDREKCLELFRERTTTNPTISYRLSEHNEIATYYP